MPFGPHSTNPRERRAYSDAMHVRAKQDPTVSNITEALKLDDQMAHGPRKSRGMGRTSLLGVAADYTVVFDGGSYSNAGEQTYLLKRGGGITGPTNLGAHLFGHIMRAIAQPEYGVGQPVMVGVDHEDRLSDQRLAVGGSLPLDEALTSPILRDTGWNIYGESYDIAAEKTLHYAAAVVIAQQLEP